MSFTCFDELDQHIRKSIMPFQENIENHYRKNFSKVLAAFQSNKVASHHLHPSFGYGLMDGGTQAVEGVFSSLFCSEASIVRPQLVTGTQALYLILKTFLHKGDTLLCLCGAPYETLQACIGIQQGAEGNNLCAQGIRYREVNLIDQNLEIPQLLNADDSVKILWIQKSCGYGPRRSISNKEIQSWIPQLREIYPQAIIAVDNCYGELVEDIEPIEIGADICAGSLLKNLGGGIAKTGAYITGKKLLVEACADMLVAPGMGFETLPNLGFTGSFLQGLFLSPLVVRESLLGNLYLSCFMQEMGFKVDPSYQDPHYDIVLKIATQDKSHWQHFANALQSSSPLDSYVTPEAFEQKGYPSPIIMAGGTFTTGSSIEFSVDGFASDPYYMYYQAGMVAEQSAILARVLFARFNKA